MSKEDRDWFREFHPQFPPLAQHRSDRSEAKLKKARELVFGSIIWIAFFSGLTWGINQAIKESGWVVSFFFPIAIGVVCLLVGIIKWLSIKLASR